MANENLVQNTSHRIAGRKGGMATQENPDK
jgi:hypothetical protein